MTTGFRGFKKGSKEDHAQLEEAVEIQYIQWYLHEFNSFQSFLTA